MQEFPYLPFQVPLLHEPCRSLQLDELPIERTNDDECNTYASLFRRGKYPS